MQEQSQILSSSVIIPLEKISKYMKMVNLSQSIHNKSSQSQQKHNNSSQSLISSSQFTFSSNRLLQLRQCLQSKPKTVYGAYSSQSLIKLLRVIEDNSQQFMQIHAINTTLSKHNKKQFLVDKLLREYCQFSYQQLLQQLHYIRHQLRDKDIYRQLLQWIKQMLTKIKYLLYKHCQVLVTVLGQCINFYIRRVKSPSTDRYQYSVILGLDKLSISFCSSNQYCQNIIHALINKLRQHCMMDGYDLQEGHFSSQQLELVHTNQFDISTVPECLIQAYERKQLIIQEKVNSISQNINSEVFYTQLIINTLVKYAQDIFYLIEGTIVFLSNLVLQKKQLKSIAYDQQYISMKHPLQQNKVIQETFMNLYCEHFQGLPQEMYRNGQKCPYCSQPVIVDEIKCFQRNRNLFQNLLKRNYLNPNGESVIYYFKDKIFSLATKQKYSNYAHYCQFVKKHCFLRDRPQPVMLLQTQKISLYSKLWGKKKLFTSDELITTPVRGKYCRHLQFFQLMRVYEKYLQRQQNQTSFQCFLCFQPIEFDQIIYLHEIKLLIDLAKYNFYPTNDCLLNTYIEVSHQHETVELCCQLEKGYMKRTYQLPIYQTLIDPLTKSEKGLVEEKSHKKEQQGEFQYTEEFSYFYFGF